MKKRFKPQLRLNGGIFIATYDTEQKKDINIFNLIDIANELDQDNKDLSNICRKQAKVLKKHGITLKQVIEEMKK